MYYDIKDRLSNSTFKRFIECPARAYAELIGETIRPSSSALIEGSYVDSQLFGGEDDVDISSLFKKDGTLYKDKLYLNTIVQNINEDDEFMSYIRGDTQKEYLFEIGGLPWKAKVDVIPEAHENMVVDFKTAKNMNDWMYSKRFSSKVPFYYARGYDIQGAVYRIATGLSRFVLAIATKTEPTAKHILEIPEEMLDQAKMYILDNQEKVWEWMKGNNLDYCTDDSCAYCRLRRKSIIKTAPTFIGNDVGKEEIPF